jgi:hypothetical protein
MATLGNKVVLFEGSETWTFDGVNWTGITLFTAPPDRIAAAMATLP